MIKRVRRVVMGEREPKRSLFTHAEEVEPLGGWHFVWGFDAIPQLPHHDTEPYVPQSLFPRPGGLRIVTLDFGERGTADDEAEVTRLIEEEPCGRLDDPEHPGMHRTDSIDIGVVISGEITSEAADGSRVVLGPGDVYIQNGAFHNWISNPENPARIVFVVIGAERVTGA